MGVLACSRNGCENIMCDRYSSEFGYICYECFEELVNLGVTDISDFMRTNKSNKWKHENEAILTYYDEIFPLNG